MLKLQGNLFFNLLAATLTLNMGGSSTMAYFSKREVINTIFRNIG